MQLVEAQGIKMLQVLRKDSEDRTACFKRDFL